MSVLIKVGNKPSKPNKPLTSPTQAIGGMTGGSPKPMGGMLNNNKQRKNNDAPK